ncbi:hypothetical protein Tco_1300192 [Tanacetum coccineum]
MCLNSWGMNSYARALVEISADNEFVESLVVAVPIAKTKGHRLVSIDIEFEYKPPRCSACKIFDHVDKECHKKEKVEMGKSSMDADLVHGKHPSRPLFNSPWPLIIIQSLDAIYEPLDHILAHTDCQLGNL